MPDLQQGGLAAAAIGTEEEESLAPTSRSVISDVLGRSRMSREQAMASLTAGRKALIDQRRDKSARWLAFAQGMLTPTRTGSFGESLGYTAGAVGKVKAAERKREVDYAKIEAAVGPTSAQRMWNQLTEGLSEEDREKAERIKLGLDPRMVGTGEITTAVIEGLTDAVAKSQEIIEERKEFAKKTGASRSKAIDKGYDTIQKINKHVLNLDRAYDALKSGAVTGFIPQYLPSIREATIIFDQIQKELGLDIIGATTFGALSAGELALALATGIPPALEPPELMQWIQDKKAAQLKLKDYYMQQIDFLDRGGSIAGWIRERERELSQTQQGAGAGAGAGAGLTELSEEDLDRQIEAAQAAAAAGQGG